MHPEKIQNQKWKGWLSEMETRLRLQKNHYSKANSKKQKTHEKHIVFSLLHHMHWFLEVLAFATSNRMKLIVWKREKLITTGSTVCESWWSWSARIRVLIRALVMLHHMRWFFSSLQSLSFCLVKKISRTQCFFITLLDLCIFSSEM